MRARITAENTRASILLDDIDRLLQWKRMRARSLSEPWPFRRGSGKCIPWIHRSPVLSRTRKLASLATQGQRKSETERLETNCAFVVAARLTTSCVLQGGNWIPQARFFFRFLPEKERIRYLFIKHAKQSVGMSGFSFPSVTNKWCSGHQDTAYKSVHNLGH
jgi:hypothetical protein